MQSLLFSLRVFVFPRLGSAPAMSSVSSRTVSTCSSFNTSTSSNMLRCALPAFSLRRPCHDSKELFVLLDFSSMSCEWVQAAPGSSAEACWRVSPSGDHVFHELCQFRSVRTCTTDYHQRLIHVVQRNKRQRNEFLDRVSHFFVLFELSGQAKVLYLRPQYLSEVKVTAFHSGLWKHFWMVKIAASSKPDWNFSGLKCEESWLIFKTRSCVASACREQASRELVSCFFQPSQASRGRDEWSPWVSTVG